MECPNCHAENREDSRFCSNCAAPLSPAGLNGASLTKTLVTPPPVVSEDAFIAGKYKIMEELGRGGMGIVYKAEDIRLQRTVALKFLPPELTHIPEVKDRFVREAQAAAALDHPNICTVYEFDQAGKNAFISMAYIEGQSLRKRIDSDPLELEEALRIAAQVAEGLQEAHKRGIIHRDIKSANIMIDSRGQAKVMDFGLSRIAGATLVTREGTTMGTVTYMSPEQARGDTVDHRTDIWSFGVILYEMLTGELPFKGEHEQAIIHSILKEKPRPITEQKAGIPPTIEQLVFRALEKDPDKRYQQIDELLDDLKSISAGIVPDEIKARLRKDKLRKRKKALLYAGAAGFLVILAVLGLILLKGPPETINSIAVLPLENLTGNPDQAYFVDGVTDELIGQLGQISGLRRVISRTSVMRYKDTDKSLPEIARELKVDALVEGTVYQVGENVSIKLQLFDALPEERSLWTQRYDRPITDVLVMYGEMAGAIAENIQVKLTAQEETRLASARQVNPDAYDAYLKGMFHLQRFNLEDLKAAQQYFESALEKDPDFALVHMGIGLFWVFYASTGIVPINEAAPKAVAAAKRSIELDDSLAEAHYVLAVIRYVFDWDWEEAEASFRKAIELNPNYPDVRGYYAQFLFNMHRPDEAIVQMERALELDPINAMFSYMYGVDLVFMRRYDEAIEQLQKVLKIAPNHTGATDVLAQVFHQKGMYDNAFEQLKAYYASIDSKEGVEALSRGYEKAGYQGAIKSAIEMWEELAKVTYVLPWNVAQVYAYAGNKEKTLDWLEKGVDVRDANMGIIGVTPLFVDLLKDEPRYHDLLRKMNLEAAVKD